MAKSPKSQKPIQAARLPARQRRSATPRLEESRAAWSKEIKINVDVAATVRELRKGVAWLLAGLGGWHLVEAAIRIFIA